ncbi:gamma-glutamyltransferase [Haliangium sp.]|uniref:gamma-glutamyltransferase n=1 Tax=Haliangium sp. TaxID=2663208 RepID=UPI003D13121E
MSTAVAAGSEGAVAAGLRVAELGGNAVDVAVSTAVTAMVSEILMCSLGGSAFVMIHIPDRVSELIEGADAMPGLGRRGPAPAPCWRSVHVPWGEGVEVMAGHGAVAVPGALAALETAWQRHGGLPWRELVAPAHELAKAGVPATRATVEWLHTAGDALFGHQAESRACFFPDGPEPPQVGALMRLPDLADALDYIAHEGARAFYEGDIAALFAREMGANGGSLGRADMSAYRAEVWAPLALSSCGFELALTPPPAADGAAAGALIALLQSGEEARTDAKRALDQARAQARVVRAQARASHEQVVDRQHGAHADADALLYSELLAGYARALRSPNSVHISVVTGDGCAVAITAGMGHGAGITVPGTGIACNDSVGQLVSGGSSEAASELRAGTRLGAAVSPVIAWHPRDGRAVALGASGPSRPSCAVAQAWTRYALEGMSFEDAVAAPRLRVEPSAEGVRVHCEPGVEVGLLDASMIVCPFEQIHRFFGGVRLAARDHQGRLYAVIDPRLHGVGRVWSPRA